jgi:hypothetical protein
MKIVKARQTYLLFALILGGFLISGCGGGGNTGHWLPRETTRPTVTAVVPLNNAGGVAINRNITATFSEAMDPLTVTTATFPVVDNVGTPVSGTVTPSGMSAVFNPTDNLAANTTYTATITTGAKDLAGNALASNYVWSFTTGATADSTAPTVTLTSPDNAATSVVINSDVNATFSEAMDPLTVTTATFTVVDNVGTPVSGTVTPSGVNAVFNPTGNLAANTTYTATITTGARDLAGNALASNYVWTFTTITTVALGPQPVDLGTAGNFVALGKSGISTTGLTAITGNIGVSPAAASSITGFGLIMDSTNTFSTSSLVTGNVYAANYTPPTPANMTTAISDMETAFTDAAGRTLSVITELGAGDISGMTLAPGLYKWGTGVTFTGVTLSGGANDVWIFQIAQTLTVANGAIVTLSGGAEARNIFWQVSGQATLGTTSDFKGNILGQTAIVVQTGAHITGRVLAQTAVTFDATTLTAP